MLAQQLLNGVVTGSIYALFAMSFTLVFGVNNILNLAQGAIFAWGALVALLAVTEANLSFAAALALAAIASAVLAVVVDFVAFRPLRSGPATEFGPIVTSIGAGLILTSLAQQVSHTQVMRFPFGTFPIVIFQFAGLRIQLLQLLILSVTGALLFGLSLYLYHTDIGRQIRAVALDAKTAQLLGINPGRTLTVVFLLSGALAGIAGCLIGLTFNSVHFLMGEPLLLRALVVVVLGGLGSIVGAAFAGLLLGVVQALSVAYLSSGFADAVIFSLMFLALAFRPSGLLGGVSSATRVVRQ